MTEPFVDDFLDVATPQPHPRTTRRLLASHPEIRHLIGRNPWTAVATACLVAAQTGIALTLSHRHAPLWLVVVVAYTAGAIIDHALWAMIHEATHRLVFPGRSGNTVVGLLANLPLMVPGYAYFERYHLRHHSYLGVYEHDVGLPDYREAQWVGHSAVRKTLWLLAFPLIYGLRPLHLVPRDLFDRRVLSNGLMQVAYMAVMVVFGGAGAMLYLAFSFFFAIGLHPLGARWIQEHSTLTPDQETYSYYGRANGVSFNIGYHNEHHDFPSIPWNRLPDVRAIAREHYDTQLSYTSWTRLLLTFVSDPRYSLWAMVRRNSSARTAAQA